MLNFAGFVNCSNMYMGEDCCHVSNKVKACCVKPINITSKERLSNHCGCNMQESQPVADLYNDLKSSNSVKSVHTLVHNSSVETGYDPVALSGLVHKYSPPIRDVSGTYLTNLSIRI
ncbi:MAG: hypothetical protein K8I03_10300 [Ignavibacteria bacterium]|nr:hypothetical protein [Ignavibacteria bacterium]